jgi:hypothetical protein
LIITKEEKCVLRHGNLFTSKWMVGTCSLQTPVELAVRKASPQLSTTEDQVLSLSSCVETKDPLSQNSTATNEYPFNHIAKAYFIPDK